ncbi:uncharacterized protein TNCV_2550201 [Trichonephila clavipes]|nr:uncharacterized protein TNCV_2550201 [Trichonephila clavipes]
MNLLVREVKKSGDHCYRACLGRSWEGNCNSQPSSDSHPGNENSVAEWDQLPPRRDKLPYFKHDITLRGLYNCKRGPYRLLTHFLCLFCNHCFIPSTSNECYNYVY